MEAYIIAGFRTAVTKSKRGGFRFYRPDDLAVDVIKGLWQVCRNWIVKEWMTLL